MILFLSRALVRVAARRWRDESQMRQEWLAELDFLAAHRGPWKVLSYGAGLVFARPAQAPVIGFTWRTLATVLFLIAGPFGLFVFLIAVVTFLGRVAPMLPDISSPRAQWVYFAIFLAVSYRIGRWWGARSVLIGPAPLALGLGLSVSATFLLAPLGLNAYNLYLDQLRAGQVWAPALVLIIFLVARAAQRGWGGRAMLAAMVLWLVVLDIAIMVQFWPLIGHDPHMGPGLVFYKEHAPIWFLGALTNDSLGVLNANEMFQIMDDANWTPHILIALAVYAMSYAIAAVRTTAKKAVPPL